MPAPKFAPTAPTDYDGRLAARLPRGLEFEAPLGIGQRRLAHAACVGKTEGPAQLESATRRVVPRCATGLASFLVTALERVAAAHEVLAALAAHHDALEVVLRGVAADQPDAVTCLHAERGPLGGQKGPHTGTNFEVGGGDHA